MKKPIFRLLVLILSITTNITYAQTCECTDCPVDILDVQTVTSVLDVSGLTNATLNSGGQAICEVSLQYEHSWISDIEILLIAPDGSSIFLLADGAGGSTSNSTWDITFVSCGGPVAPDPGANNEYTSSDFGSNSSYNGIYYPGDGCFSDLTGSANGEWTLQVNDLVTADIGEVTNWSITFCDGTGLSCSASVCEADMGTFDNSTQTFCNTDDPIEAAPIVTGDNTDPDYTTTWVILSTLGGSTDEIIGYSETADFTGFDPGEYFICGLNYLIADENVLPATNSGNTNDDINDLIDDGSLCANFGFACASVIIEDCGCAAEAGFFVIGQDLFCEFDVIDLLTEVTDENQDSDYGYNFPIFNNEGGGIGTLIEYSEDAILSGYDAGQYWVCGLSYLLSDESLLTPANGSNTDVDIIDDINNEVFCGDFDNHCYLIVIEEEVELPILDFETEICVGQLSEITVLNYDPDAIYNVTVNSGSFSMLFTGVPTTEFIPQNDIDIEICFTILSACGDLQSCANITVNESSADDLMIEGPDELCLDILSNYTLSGFGSSTIVGWTISGDASLVGSTTNDNVDVQIDNVVTTGSAELCVEVIDECGENVEECITITVTEIDLENATFPDFCDLEFNVEVLINGDFGTGLWSVISAPGSVIFDDANQSSTDVIVDAVGDYTLLFTSECSETLEVDFIVYDPLTASNVEVICMGNMYTISFDISGGLAPYFVNDVEVSGTTFVSDLIDDDPYELTLTDAFSCLPLEISGDPECGCAAEAGNINISNLSYCESDNIELNPTVNDENEDADYGYTFTISNYESGSIGTLEAYDENADLTGFPTGQYWVCGLSYLLTDESLLPPANGSNSNLDIQDLIFDGTICAELGAGCYVIDIAPEAELPILDFETEICVGQSSSVTVLNYDPDATYGVQINSGSFSMLSTGTPTTTFTPQTDQDIEICIVNISPCGDQQACASITVNASSSDDLMIEGPDELCPDNLINYTLTGLDENTIVGWTISGDASIVGSTTDDNVDVQIDNEATTGNAELCIEVINDCGENVEVCLDITVIDNELTNNTPSDFCTLDFDVSVLIDGGDGVGVWTVVTAPVGVVVFDNLNNSTTGVSVTFPFLDVADFVLQFTYQCNQSIEVAFTVTEPIETENVEVECSGDMYTVSFDIIGGLSPYSVNGTEITGNSYTSALLNDDPYSFTISDDSDCGDLILTGNSECECQSNAGTINPQDLLVSCENETVTATNNGDAFLDSDDTGIWILYSDLADPLGSIILENNTGDFTFVSPLNYMVTYFIAYIVGNEVGGTVDLADPCLDIADGTSIIFSEPFELTGITVDPLNTCGSEFQLTAIQVSPIAGNWGVSNPAGGTSTLSNINGISTNVTLEGVGDFIITYSTADGLCSVTEEVTIAGAEIPAVDVINIECNDDNSNYTVTIEVTGGVSPYSVDGVEFSGNTFFSPIINSGDSYDYIIVDANGCESESVSGIFLCNCDSFAGSMPTEAIEICGQAPFTSVNNEDESLDGNDALIYILHTSSDNTIGTIIDENQTGTFSFLPTMIYGTTYYISAVVGNQNGSSVDYTDECLSVATGQAVTWYEEIIISNIISDPEIGCDVFNLTANTNSAIDGIWTVISSPTGSTVTLSDNNAINTIATVDIAGTYTLAYEQNNGPCSAFEEVSFILSSPPTISNIIYECDEANENYTVSFDISGGQAPYLVNGSAISGSTFTSPATPNGISTDYVVTDVNGCMSNTITTNNNCSIECTSEAGTMPNDIIELCYDETINSITFQVNNNSNFFFDDNDTGIYVLHTGDENIIQFPLAESIDGVFDNFVPTIFNTALYVSYVVGNEINGTVDLSDPCLSVSLGQPIIFFDTPNISLGEDLSICGLETNLTADILEVANTNVTWINSNAPDGATLTTTENSSNNIDISVDQEGTYTIVVSASNILNNSCISSDSIDITFTNIPTVSVMDDFTSCSPIIDITSTDSGGSGVWTLPELQAIIFSALPSNTTVDLDTFGTFNIVRFVTNEGCTASDTVTVEVFPQSEFLVTDIFCDNDNENYIINYEIEGDNYPYTINGQEVQQGETILLTAASGTDLELNIFDNNQCEIINTVFNKSCECQSQLEDNAQDLIRACIQDTMFITPVENFTLAEGDSLIYVLHSASGEEITDIISVSADPFFLFDATSMSTMIPYFVTAVIYNGGEFSLNSLNSNCTVTDLGRPVIWFGPSQTFIEDQALTFCESTDVIIPINHVGQVPIIVGISNTNGTDFQIEITEEGITEVVVPMDGSGFVSIAYVVPLFFCENTFEGVATVNITSSPSLELVESISLCDEISEGNTSIALNDLIINNSAEGQWTDQDGMAVSGIIDFSGMEIGDYIYTYTIVDDICGNEISSTIISVEDCLEIGCPTEVILPLPEVCEGGSVVNLNDFVLPEYVDLGYWTLVEGGVNIVVEVPDVTIGTESTGQVEFFYTLPGLDEECDSTFFDAIIINESLSAGESINSVNEYCLSEIQNIVLFDLIENYDAGGSWSSNDTESFDAVSGILNLGDLSFGSYQFNYTVGSEIESCPESISTVFVQINENESVQINVTDPLCFGIDDGSIEVLNQDGIPFENFYQLYDEDGESLMDENMLSPGTYIFEGIGQNGCDILSGFVVNDPLEIFLDLGIDIIIEEGDTATISSNTNLLDDDISLYEWIVNQSTIDAPTYENLTLNPSNESLVLLTITDDDGCIVSDDILISLISSTPPEVEVILPNIFNANSSSFGVEAFEKIENVEALLIYDRWGNNVFVAEDYDPRVDNQTWTGDYKGNPAMSGVYVYYLRYNDINGRSQILSGDITLIR